ncbi:hypothetical protein SCT_3157 [Sulfuricella sp. T08]|nr:hypothetical protein SCT_3157 [Sulfuricella sp. T08]
MPLPHIGHLAQQVGGVVHAGRRLDAQGVELGRIGIDMFLVLVLELGKTRDYAAAIAEHANGTALPVTFSGRVGCFQLTHQVNHHIVVISQALEAGHKAGPWAAFQLVEKRRVVLFLSHGVIS